MDQTSDFIETESGGASYPQDYSLKTADFLTSNGKTIDIRKLITKISYYEDIYTFAVSGHITLIDAQGFIELLRLTGNEFLKLDFGKVSGAKNDVIQTFRVYKIGDRSPSGTLNSEAYTMYFCSEELLLSEQTKISKSYKGKKITEIIKDIVTNQLKVSSKKIEKIEETMGVYDFLVPRLKPLEAISWLSCYARPLNATGADMLFFETRNGFNFRSIQSMFKGSPYATYKYQAKNLDDKTQSFQEKALTVLDYEFGKPYDMLNEVNSGTLANRLVSIDPLARKYTVTDFDYEKYKAQATSINKNSPTNNFKNRLGKTENQSYDAVFKVMIGNSAQQNIPYIKEKTGAVAKDVFVETFVPSRTAQISLANYTTLKISIPGDPGVTAGRIINFNLLSLKGGNEKDLDKLYSGKYLVTAVRHVVDIPTSYITILELAKDSNPNPVSSVDNDTTTWKEVISE